jgi:hypothetical protein
MYTQTHSIPLVYRNSLALTASWFTYRPTYVTAEHGRPQDLRGEQFSNRRTGKELHTRLYLNKI